MSVGRYQAFAMLPNRIIRDHDLPLAALKFACVIAMHRDSDGGWTTMGSKVALCRMGLTRASDRGHIGDLAKLLAARGYIDYLPGSGGQRSRYRLIMDQKAPTAEQMLAEDEAYREAEMEAAEQASIREDEERERRAATPSRSATPTPVGASDPHLSVQRTHTGVGALDLPIRETLSSLNTPSIQTPIIPEKQESLTTFATCARESDSIFETVKEVAQEPELVLSPESPKPASEPVPPSKNRAAPSKNRDPAGTRLPDDWTPGNAGYGFATDLGLNAQKVFEEFRDYWAGVPGARGRKADWDATWRNQCRRSADRPGPNGRRQGEIGGLMGAVLRHTARREAMGLGEES